MKTSIMSNKLIPISIDFIFNVYEDPTIAANSRDIWYLKAPTDENAEVSISDIKEVSKSKTIKDLIKTALSKSRLKADKEKAKEAKDKLSEYSFYVKFSVTDEDIKELLKLNAQIKELDDRKKTLNNLISTDAMLYYNNNGECMPDIITEDGSISSNVAITIVPDKVRTLRRILKDKGGDYVERKSVYEITGKANTIIKILIAHEYNDKISMNEFISKLLSNPKKEGQKSKGKKKSTSVITADELITGMKSTVSSNTDYFTRLFDIDQPYAENMARLYNEIKNYQAICEFAESCGVDPADTDALNKLIDNVKSCISVKTTHRLTIKSK